MFVRQDDICTCYQYTSLLVYTSGRLYIQTVFQCSSVPVFQCSSVPVYQCSVPVYQCTSVPVYQCTSVPVYQCTSVSVYQCTSVPVYQCTSYSLTYTGAIHYWYTGIPSLPLALCIVHSITLRAYTLLVCMYRRPDVYPSAGVYRWQECCTRTCYLNWIIGLISVC